MRVDPRAPGPPEKFEFKVIGITDGAGRIA
jgi:hypothetical protein